MNVIIVITALKKAIVDTKQGVINTFQERTEFKKNL